MLCIAYLFEDKEIINRIFEMVDEEDIENGSMNFGTWRQEVGNDLPGLAQQSGNRSSNDVREFREELCDYFNTNCQVSWQWNFL